MPVTWTTSSLSRWVAPPPLAFPVTAKTPSPFDAMPPAAQIASPWPPVDHAGHVDRSSGRVDDRRARDAGGVAAAGEAVARRRADAVHPDDGARGLVERVDHVAQRDGEEDALTAGSVLEVQRRGPHAAA